MKPRIIVRILLVLVMLAQLALGLGLIGVALGLVTPQMLEYITALPYATAENGWITAGIGAGLILLAIILIAGVNRRAPRKAKEPAAAVISRGELGVSSITLAAIDEMIHRHCAENGNVKACDAAISVKEDKLSIGLKLSLAPEANVAATSAALRESLVQYLQEYTGITVGDVGIMIVTAAEKAAAVQAS